MEKLNQYERGEIEMNPAKRNFEASQGREARRVFDGLDRKQNTC